MNEFVTSPWMIALALGGVLILAQAVMAHDPVAIEPDADRGDGVEVATFALG